MSIETKTADSTSEKREAYDVEELSNVPSSPQDEFANIDEKKLVRKIDFVLIPWLSFLYLVAFLDRTSIGNAKVSVLLELFGHANTIYSYTIWKPISIYQTPNT